MKHSLHLTTPEVGPPGDHGLSIVSFGIFALDYHRSWHHSASHQSCGKISSVSWLQPQNMAESYAHKCKHSAQVMSVPIFCSSSIFTQAPHYVHSAPGKLLVPTSNKERKPPNSGRQRTRLFMHRFDGLPLRTIFASHYGDRVKHNGIEIARQLASLRATMRIYTAAPWKRLLKEQNIESHKRRL